MARCGCSGSTCSCLIVSGAGTNVSGTGTVSNPYVVDVIGSDVQGTIAVADTDTIDMTMTGTGSTADPYTISGEATLSMEDLSDVDDTPAAGEVPVFDGTSWGFAAPPTTPPGAVNVGDGLSGDGSAADPLEVDVSGVWGTAPLNIYGADTLLGQVTYIDTNGQVRVEPDGPTFVPAGGTRPNQYPGRMIIQQAPDRLLVSDGSVWRDPVTHTCTSTTRPTAPWVGMHVWETDSRRELVWTGSTWAPVYEDSEVDVLDVSSRSGADSGWTINSGLIWRRDGTFGFQLGFTLAKSLTVPSNGNITNEHLTTITDPYWRPNRATAWATTLTGVLCAGFVDEVGRVWLTALGGRGVEYTHTSGTSWTVAGTGQGSRTPLDPAAGW